MKLTLDREDLKPEFQSINCSQTRLEHFKPEVQAAVIQAGGAQFREYDGSNYNAILVPENKPLKSKCVVCKKEIVFDDESGIWRHLIGTLHSAFPAES